MDLTKQDLDILIEAMDAWVHKDFGGQVIVDIVGLMLAETPEQKQKVKEEREREHRVMKGAQKLREEQSILLKAKLFKMRDSVEAENFCKDS